MVVKIAVPLLDISLIVFLALAAASGRVHWKPRYSRYKVETKISAAVDVILNDKPIAHSTPACISALAMLEATLVLRAEWQAFMTTFRVLYCVKSLPTSSAETDA